MLLRVVALCAVVVGSCRRPNPAFHADGSTGGASGGAESGVAETDGAGASGTDVDADTDADADVGGGSSTSGSDGSGASTGSEDDPVVTFGCDGTDPDLVACYTLDDADGNTFADGSMYANHGTLLGGSATVGLSGAALVVSEQTEAVAPNGAWLDFGDAVTVDLWIRADVIPDEASIQGYALKKGGSYEVVLMPEGRARCESTRGSSIGGSVTLGVWTHVACVDDGSNVVLYVNGDEVASTPVGPPIGASNGTDVVLGNMRTFARPFLGAIDNVRIWRIPLDPVDICLAAGRDDC